MQHEEKTRELGVEKIGKLLWKYSIPSIISMIVVAVYNIVDRIFIGHGVGPLAIAGLALTFPIMNIMQAFGTLIGVGGSARLSIVLGKKDIRWAEEILGNSLILTLLFSGGVCVLVYLLMDPILYAFGGTEQTINYARDYLMIVLPGCVFTSLTFNLSGLMRSSGYPNKSMYVNVLGAICNIILDPIFIFVLDMGIKGAALATLISMIISASWAVQHFIKKNSFIRFHRHGFILRGYIFRNITLIGVSPFLMNVAASGVVLILNWQLMRYGGDYAVGAYGIINSFASFLVLFILGFCQGMQPIVGYNYGAGYMKRMKHAFFLTIQCATAVAIVGFISALFAPELIVKAFTGDSQLIQMSARGLRFILLLFPLVGFIMVNSNFFQSIDKPWVAILVSLSRQVLFLIPLTFLMPYWFEQKNWSGLDGVWIAAPIADILSFLLALFLLLQQRKKIFHYEHKTSVKENGKI